MHCSRTRTSKKLLCNTKIIYFLSSVEDPLIRKLSYVNVYMKRKKDPCYDSIDAINQSPVLKPLISLKNCIAQSPCGCIPISDVSKRGLELDVPIKVAKFLRMYPSVFEEFVGPQYNLPWFRLTPKAMEIHVEERAIYEDYKSDLQLRLRKLISLTREKRLPLRIIQGVQWYLGLPEGFLKNPEVNLDESFRFVEMEDGERALAVDCEEKIMSFVQKNAVNRGLCSGGWMEPIPIPLFPSRGLRLKRKISVWLEEFQKLPYVSPYEDFSHLSPDSDIAEKRVVGVLHELLCLFVEHAAQRKNILCLKKFLSLPQKFHKAFERHPHIFYLSLKAHNCTAILKEAYEGEAAIEVHPLFAVRKKYIELMKDSNRILKQRRFNNHVANGESADSDPVFTSEYKDEDDIVVE